MKSSSTLLHLLHATCLASLLTACGNNATDASGTAAVAKTGFAATSNASEVTSANAYTPPANSGTTAQNSPMKARDLSAAPVASSVLLEQPTVAQLAKAKKNGTTGQLAKRVQVGFSRTVAQTGSVNATQQLLNWTNTNSGGKVAAISFTSQQAKNTRLGLLVTQLPEAAIVRFYAQNAMQAHEFSGNEIQSALAKNLAAGDKTDAGRTFWGPVIEGVESTIEIELPAGVATSAVQVAVPKLAHAFISSDAASQQLISPQTGSFNGSLVCEVSITCTTPLPAVSNAILNLLYIDALDGLYYTCSATFINDSISSGSIYVLTANHCIDNQTTASSISPALFYRSNCDGGGSSNTGYGPRASLLFTSYTTDSTLLKFYPNEYGYNPVNAGAVLAGWDATTPPAANIAVTGIHHPNGDPQRISSGTMTSNVGRDALGDFYYTTQAAGTFLEVVLTNGIVEHGSSGSALFKNFSTNPQVIGQLYGGIEAVCSSNNTNNPQQTLYGRFDKAYTAGMSDWLNPVGNKSVARYYNTQSGTHFYTIRASEKTYVKDFPQFSFESEPFKASVEPVAGLNPVHRFYNLNLGVYFYTISESERAWVVANLLQMRYEGIAWYAQPGAGGSTIPLYRFYNTQKGVHFYTVSASERASVIANLPQMTDEGIAYYVLP